MPQIWAQVCLCAVTLILAPGTDPATWTGDMQQMERRSFPPLVTLRGYWQVWYEDDGEHLALIYTERLEGATWKALDHGWVDTWRVTEWTDTRLRLCPGPGESGCVAYRRKSE